VENETASPVAEAESSSPGADGAAAAVASRPRGSWWVVTALAVCGALILGAFAEHVRDQHSAAQAQYRMQVLTTVSRFLTEEERQIALPLSQRSAPAFGDLADSISSDEGVNGSGTLQVTLGTGSTAPAGQIAFSGTVDSPYASTTFVVWDLSVNGGSAQNQGACVLGSSLIGPGRATSALGLGGGAELQACSPGWWAAGPVTARQPRLGLAGIPRSPR
jgi:hypothetical protein